MTEAVTNTGGDWLRLIVGLILVLIFSQLNALFLVWLERKVAGHIQLRYGPMEVGPHGLLQTIVDGIKLVGKELITPFKADKKLFVIAPVLVFMPVLVPFLVLPFGPELIIRDMNVGLLLIFAFSTFSVLAILVGGWASNNKYALLGAIRSVAQNVAYEIPLLLSVMSVVLMVHSFKFSELVMAQQRIWFIFLQPVAAIIYFICATAETNRAPFDIPEAESELVAGFHTEYSGMRFGLFFLAEYTNMFIVCAVATSLFLGGWHGPFGFSLGIPGVVWFLAKTYFLLFVLMWFRWTFPRVRFDQLMNFSWKVLIPLSMLNLLVTALVLKFV
ncbi:NADH dehydrogenase subunit H [Desulfacinum infernum DSM 9756]|jgi:NADH-quinone oxidoreductase subunit H|uniref:NADH-quinone oxidoreductase subunit H n=1 Tax=Desulfacinum infernum DSM 9756 TaxID=1121391 RepID=A0A1M5C5E8_9BACT|nr:NADH-quinone oxidoreductase subunit NuoH [Desulfacinum infernum]SHF49642.1 NADH dehydrogenase subunit H [Desulfacinum infernum DSM 9756]